MSNSAGTGTSTGTGTTPPSAGNPLIEVEDLAVRFRTDHGIVDAVRGVSFTIEPGRCVALVGESGSGKSVSARALLGLNGAGARTTAARLRFDGRDLRGLRDREWRRIRGGGIGYVLQDALGSLDPLRTVGQELDEAVRLQDRTASRAERRERSLELLRRAHMPDPERRLDERSPQLSGGLRQRALIATALAGRPRLLIADEPTTALDVTVQSRILRLFRGLQDDGFGLLFISHDLAAVSEVADDVLVLRDGEVVEQGPAARVLASPEHPYTQALLDAVPSRRSIPARPETGDREVLVSADDLVRRFRSGPAGAKVERTALGGVSVRVRRGTTLGVVGESGSGKTTLSRILAGIDTATSGTVQGRLPDRPGAVQYVYQDPLASFDPRYTVERVVTEAIRVRRPRADRGTVSARVVGLLADVGLDASFRTRRPVQLSGGQRQRIAIARALAAEPELIVLDEPVSALDVSVQAQILDLLDGIQRASGITMVFVSHDLGVVRQVSDEVVVMRDGQVVATGPTAAVLVDPEHEYTRELIAAIPTIRSST